jgi:DNA excision repair protein ERCC-6
MADSTAGSPVALKRQMSSPQVVEDQDAKMSHEDDEAAQMIALAADIRDQDDIERAIGQQADQLLFEQADDRDQKRLDKTQKEKDRLQGLIRRAQTKLSEFGNSTTKNKYRAEIEQYKGQIATLDTDLAQIQKRMDARRAGTNEDDAATVDQVGSKPMLGESRREFLIRTGKITPFSKQGRQLLRASSSLGDVLIDAENEDDSEVEDAENENLADAEAGHMSHQNLLMPGFDQKTPTETIRESAPVLEDDAALAQRLQDEEFAMERPAKRRRLQARGKTQVKKEEVNESGEESDAYMPECNETERADEEELDEDDMTDDIALATTPGNTRKRRSRHAPTVSDGNEAEDLAGIDDGNEDVYQARLQDWVRRRRSARSRAKVNGITTDDGDDGTDSTNIEHSQQGDEEWHMPHPTRTDAVFEGGFAMPGDIYPSLFDYQKTGVQWLWELYSQQVGGIVGDEMGLGKTIQVISFLAGLHYSRKITKPIIVVCPATVMKQWVNEFHRWWPPLRVSILHSSGSGMLDVRHEAQIEDDLSEVAYRRKNAQSKGYKSAKRIVDRVIRDGHVLVTTYSGLQTYAELLIPTDWGYAVLDEGHKIRNPNTSITIYCKELRTHNRVILSGTPMQNNLTELWSLFDFVFPMRLGTLVNFKSQFEIPIKQGGYASASNLQVETAMKCAETLKDTIAPYLLQRFKVDVAADLPKKSERVLFCKLTKLQRDAYEWFLSSEDMKSIMNGRRQALYGVDILRKICNHPDLVEHKTLSKKSSYAYGEGSKSGKMQVVKGLLEIWKRHGHKTLLFAQHRIMLDILELFIAKMPGFKFLRMDGNTSIKDRQTLVDRFNTDPELHVFLLTTKVGGLGVNLTGANRVIIYDPDWNPSTDMQARERAWRLGQKREVEIYRLMTAGTIEEKIYHRQIFKQFLTNKILRDPKQRQTFQLRDLHDLFTLGDATDGETETGTIFKGTEVQLSGFLKTDADQDLPTQPDDKQAVNDDATTDTAMNDIMGISRHERFHDEAEEAANAPTTGDGESNDRVLNSIFARAGVQSALEHDAIINGTSRTITADPEMIAREARKVAAEAARELQRAGEIARTLPAGVPTWTGQLGTAGRPPSPPRRGGMGSGRGGRGGGAGPSSAALLANLQSRQAGSQSSSARGGSHASARANAAAQPKGKDFLVLIRDYLVAQGGQAYTQMLIDHFNRFCGTPQRTLEFKEMLKSIAVLEKGGRARGKWRLKEEFRRGVA